MYSNLCRRGPDLENCVKTILDNQYSLHMHSSVLHLRGQQPVEQPFRNSNGDLLQWNGDIFGGLEVCLFVNA